MNIELKKNELNETEMHSITGGWAPGYDFLYNDADRNIFYQLSKEHRDLILAQPDRASRRAKMLELWNATTTHAHGTGASGGW